VSADASDLRARLQHTLSGSYTIERELGGGGMSRVFVAEEMRLKRQIVIKVLSPELAQGISVERFEREIQLAASLQQANIVPVLSAGDTDGLPWFTMPFVEGESLRVRLARGPLSTTETIGVLRDVTRALAYAHSRGIVHRDIKPDNVLLSAGTAVVTDFGIAKAISAARTGPSNATLTQVGTSIGTPAYMAPEQAAGDPEVDFRADIYALGCMAYELLAGQPPFAGRTAQRVLAAHMGEAPRNIGELRPDLPIHLRDLVMQCLAKDPDGRPQSAAELGRALDSITSGQMIAPPAILLGGRESFQRALLIYVGCVVAVIILVKAAIVGIGLPDWVLPGAIAVMALGLPAVLFTGYVQRVNRRMVTATPTLTPGGTRSAVQPGGTMATLAIKATPYVSWHRTARGGIYALGAFVLLVAAFMGLRMLGIGPSGSLLAAGKIKAKAPILVTDFTIHNADTSLATVLGDATRSGLASSTVISLVTPAQAASTLRLMQRSATTHIDVAVARDIAARDGAAAIIDGEATGVGGGYIVSMRLISAETGNELASFHETGDGPKGLIDAVDKLTRNVRSRIGESLRDVHATPPLDQVTTPSLAALQKYSAGARAADVESHFVAAAALLREAVAIDSTFAEAWRKLGITLFNEYAPQSQTDAALAQAYRYRAKLPASEQLVITATYFSSGPGRDRVQAIAAYQRLAATDPHWINNLAVEYEMRREYAPAESLFRVARTSDPKVALPYNNLASALLAQGKWAAADSAIDAVRTHFPNNHAWMGTEVQFLRMHGQVDSAQAMTDRLQRSTDADTRLLGMRIASSLAREGGRVAEWARLRTAIDQQSPGDPAQLDTAITAMVDGWPLGDPERGVQRLDAELARVPLRQLAESDRPYFDVAAAYALDGRADKARAVLAQYQAEVKDTALRRQQDPLEHTVLGEIALSEHKPQVALAEFRRGDSAADGAYDACASCLPLELGRAFDAAEQADSAILMYERYLATPHIDLFANSWDASAHWLAAVHFRLGELYEARNDGANAMKQYQAFVELYQHADPAVQPKVADARTRIAKLRERVRQAG
jgi:hypothetical protein